MLKAILVKKKKPTRVFPTKSADIPVTQKMLYGVRDQLQAEISAVQFNLEGSIEKQGGELRSSIKELNSIIEKQNSRIHQTSILVEEQNARNKIVLDGLTMLFERQARLMGK